MRNLSAVEIAFVSGGEGLPEVKITAPRLKDGWQLLSGSAFERLIAKTELQLRPWQVVILAWIADEVKEFAEEYIEESTGYEDAKEWLKDQLDEMVRLAQENTCGTSSNGRTISLEPCGVPDGNKSSP